MALLIFIVSYVRDNLPRAGDLNWLAKGGGMFGGEEVPSHRFNAGEKIVFWGGVIVLGLIVVASGLVLDKLVPGMAYTRGDMQIAHMIHAVASVLMMAMFFGHIYIGTIGMKGAYQAHAHRLCRRGLGQGAPRALVRRHQGRQDPGAALARGRAATGRRA